MKALLAEDLSPPAEEAVFSAARMVLDDRVVEGAVVVRDGVIVEIEEGQASPLEDGLEGEYLLPGLVELHTDHLEGHFLPRPGVSWNAQAAVQAHDAQIAASGITTVFDALRVGMDADTKGRDYDPHALAEAILAAQGAGRLRAEHYIHMRCEIATEDVVSAARALIETPIVKLASVMDHTPGQRQFVRLDKYRTYYQGKTGMSDAEMDAYMAQRLDAHHRFAPGQRRMITDLCAERGVPLASHDDATEDHVAEAIDDGVVIAEFPTTREAAASAHEGGLAVLGGAPNVVLGGSHSGNIAVADLAAAGSLSLLSSDYVPFSLLQAMFILAETVPAMSLPDAASLVTRNPADAVGLGDRGGIDVGKRADLIRVRYQDGLPTVREAWREGRRIA